MLPGIESLYQQIANSIEEAVPEAWTSAQMEAIFYPDSSTYFGEYVSESEGHAKDFATTRGGERAFREIRKKFTEAGKKPWGSAIFKLLADGRFDLKFGYDGCDKNGDTVFNEEEEIIRQKDRHIRLTSSRSL